MSECMKYADDLKALVDGELPFARRWVVERHVAGCALCRDEVAAMRQIGEGIRLQPVEPLDPALRARILAAIPESLPARSRRPVPRRFSLAMAGSVAAVALLAIVFGPAHRDFVETLRGPLVDSASAPPPSSAALKVREPLSAAKPNGEAWMNKPADTAKPAKPQMNRQAPRRAIQSPSSANRPRAAMRNGAPPVPLLKERVAPTPDLNGTAATRSDSTVREQERFGRATAIERRTTELRQRVDRGGLFDQNAAPALQEQADSRSEAQAAGKRFAQPRDGAAQEQAKKGESPASRVAGRSGDTDGPGGGSTGGRARGLGGGTGGMGGGFGLSSAQSTPTPPARLGAQAAPAGPAGTEGVANNPLALGAPATLAPNMGASVVGQKAVRPQEPPTTALLGLAVENVERKREEVDRIARAANGVVTEVTGPERKDLYSLDYARAAPLEETELRLNVDAAKMSGVLDRLSKLGEVTVRQVPAPVQTEDKLKSKSDANSAYRSPQQERGGSGAGGNPSSETSPRQESARTFGDLNERVRLKEGAVLRRDRALGRGATITVVLRKKTPVAAKAAKASKGAKPAKPAQDKRKK